MPSTDDLIAEFELFVAQGFSSPNARRIVERKVAGARQLQRLREALNRLEKEEGDEGVS